MIEARDHIEDTTLRCEVEASLAKTYLQGRRSAVFGLGKVSEREAANALPTDRPYSFEQIVGAWYPQDRHGLVDD